MRENWCKRASLCIINFICNELKQEVCTNSKSEKEKLCQNWINL